MYEQERELLRSFCVLAYDRYLVSAADGNFSMRLPDNNILITPSGRSKRLIKPEEMIILDANGVKLSENGSASSEAKMHSFLYRRLPNVHAVFHSHPPYATTFASLDRELPMDYFIEAPLMLGRVPCAAFAMPGTEAIVRAIEDLVADVDCILLRNHGVLAYGITLETAFNRLETLEHVCKMTFLAEQAGTPVRIPPEAVGKMWERKREKGV